MDNKFSSQETDCNVCLQPCGVPVLNAACPYQGKLWMTKSQYRKKDRGGTLTPQERSDFNEPGPFSLVSYLEAFLDKGFYGDEITLVLINMMWQIRITVLQAETKMQTKIRHSNTLALADMVLVQTAHLHYFPVSKFC